MNRHSICCLAAVVLFCACVPSPDATPTAESTSVPTRTVEWETLPSQTLQTRIADIRYVPLESTPESFLSGISKILIHNNEIYIQDSYGNARYGIRVFSPEGRYLRHIGRTGKGPGEVVKIDDFTIRDSSVFIVDGNAEKMAVYTLDGRFREDLPLPNPDFASFAACDTGFLWTGTIYYGEHPENRYGLYKTDNRLAEEWKRKKYGPNDTRCLLVESSDSLIIRTQEGCDSVYLYNRQGIPFGCIYLDFPKSQKIPYEKRRQINELPADEDFNYYQIGAWNPIIIGPYLIGSIIDRKSVV